MASDAPIFDDPPSWARLFNLEEAERFPDQSWGADELGSVFRHQMSSPVQFDLHNLARSAAAELETLCAAEGLLIRSFADLLHHPHPPLELLTMTKRFAKVSYHHADAVIPKDIAAVLYYASILVALVRCNRRITDLDDRDLAQGVRWALGLVWLDDSTRQLLNEGLRQLGSQPNAGGDVSGCSPEKPQLPGEVGR
jgi:hypothetical protein